MASRRRDQERPSRPRQRDGEPVDLLGDPPSLERTPLPVGRSIIQGDGEDYPDEAPTVAVSDLSELGIDLDAMPSPTPAPPRPPIRPDPSRTHSGAGARPDRPTPRMKRAESDPGLSTPILVALASIPVLIAAAASIWMVWSA